MKPCLLSFLACKNVHSAGLKYYEVSLHQEEHIKAKPEVGNLELWLLLVLKTWDVEKRRTKDER